MTHRSSAPRRIGPGVGVQLLLDLRRQRMAGLDVSEHLCRQSDLGQLIADLRQIALGVVNALNAGGEPGGFLAGYAGLRGYPGSIHPPLRGVETRCSGIRFHLDRHGCLSRGGLFLSGGGQHGL
jgi:hypothetical protein